MHDNTGVIGSTGPDMTRYFSKVDDAVELVVTAIRNIDRLQGSVVSREMKSALIRDILDLWIRERGGRWEKIEGRPGERPHEFLMGEPELAYTSRRRLEVSRITSRGLITRFPRRCRRRLLRQRQNDYPSRNCSRSLIIHPRKNYSS